MDSYNNFISKLAIVHRRSGAARRWPHVACRPWPSWTEQQIHERKRPAADAKSMSAHCWDCFWSSGTTNNEKPEGATAGNMARRSFFPRAQTQHVPLPVTICSKYRCPHGCSMLQVPSCRGKQGTTPQPQTQLLATRHGDARRRCRELTSWRRTNKSRPEWRSRQSMNRRQIQNRSQTGASCDTGGWIGICSEEQRTAGRRTADGVSSAGGRNVCCRPKMKHCDWSGKKGSNVIRRDPCGGWMDGVRDWITAWLHASID